MKKSILFLMFIIILSLTGCDKSSDNSVSFEENYNILYGLLEDIGEETPFNNEVMEYSYIENERQINFIIFEDTYLIKLKIAVAEQSYTGGTTLWIHFDGVISYDADYVSSDYTYYVDENPNVDFNNFDIDISFSYRNIEDYSERLLEIAMKEFNDFLQGNMDLSAQEFIDSASIPNN